MKFKIKINENTTLDDIRKELETLKSANVTAIPLNHLLKIIGFLGATQVTATGSSIRFRHPLLMQHPYYHGYFQIHKIHKGGDQDEIRIVDCKKYLFPVLITIIELKEKN